MAIAVVGTICILIIAFVAINSGHNWIWTRTIIKSYPWESDRVCICSRCKVQFPTFKPCKRAF